VTPDALSLIIESLAAGCTRAVACKAARVSVADLAAACATDDDVADRVEAAEAEGGALAVPEPPPLAPVLHLVPRDPTWADVAAASQPDAPEPQRPRMHATPDAAPRTDDGANGGLDVETIEREAARYAPGPFGYLLWVEARLASRGFHAMSLWWRESLRAFYDSGKPWGLWCVGRGAGKSTTLERVAATNALLVPRSVPPGQTWSWPFVSVGPDDANRRIDGIAAVFRAVGLPVIGDEDESGTKAKAGVKVSHSPRASAKLCDLRGNAIALMSIAGTVGNVSGPSTIGATVDEAAKLLDKATHANPLTEIIASLAQTSRGRPGWRAIVCSSAWHRAGAHFQLIEQGDTEANYVARIGAAHLATALRGLEAVASWEEKRGDTQAAAMIRAHAATLGPESPLVPTWVANPAIGSPDGLPWEDGALATRKLVEVLPEQALGGVPRIAYWLRENASVPLDAPRSGSAVAPNMTGLGAANARLASSRRAREDGIARGYGGLLPGDPRGAGATGGGRRVL